MALVATTQSILSVEAGLCALAGAAVGLVIPVRLGARRAVRALEGAGVGVLFGALFMLVSKWSGEDADPVPVVAAATGVMLYFALAGAITRWTADGRPAATPVRSAAEPGPETVVPMLGPRSLNGPHVLHLALREPPADLNRARAILARLGDLRVVEPVGSDCWRTFYFDFRDQRAAVAALRADLCAIDAAWDTCLVAGWVRSAADVISAADPSD